MGLDPEYPRNIVRDRPADIAPVDLAGALGLTTRLIYATDGTNVLKPSEWVAPWLARFAIMYRMPVSLK